MNYDTLVLSGGGIKGFCLLGGVQAAIDNNFLNKVSIYIGTSVGAIICYLLAIGYTPVDIVVQLHLHRWLEDMKYFNLSSVIHGNGVCSFRPIYDALENMTINKVGKFLTLEQLRRQYGKTLICVTYDMTECRSVYMGPDNFPELPCIVALRMSANIPVVFDRFNYMKSFFIDGGVADNFAVAKAEEYGTKILGLYIELSDETLQDDPSKGLVTYFLRLLQIPVIQSTRFRARLATKKSTIVPLWSDNIHNAIEFDIGCKEKLEMFSEGYSEFKKCMKGILKEKRD